MVARRAATVCLVTPGHLATNPRLVKEADALCEAGYRVEVVAARFIAWADEADREFEGRPWRVHRTVFGPLAPRPLWLWQGVRRRTFGVAWRLFGRGARLAEGAFHPAIPGLFRLASSLSADLYLAHNLAALPAAGRAARRRGAALGFDAEDFHLGEIPDGPEFDVQRRLVCAIERVWLPRCRHLTASSPGIALALSQAYGIPPPLVVRNVFPRVQAPPQPQPPVVEPGPGLYWFSQTIGPHRGLECAVRALALAQSRPHLYLRGRLAKGYDDTLFSLARAMGVAERVHVLPPISPGRLPTDAASFHVGLACEEPVTRNRNLAITNKVFTYILAGIPTLLSATPAQAALGAELGMAAALFPPGDAAALARALDDLLGGADRLGNARRVAWKLGQERFNWECESRGFLAQVAAVLGVEG